LCEVYGNIRVAGVPIKVYGVAILKLILQMLTDGDTIDDEIDCICSKLFRKQVISKESSSVRRCFILKIVEFRQIGWSDPDKSLDRFYSDAIADVWSHLKTFLFIRRRKKNTDDLFYIKLVFWRMNILY